MFGRLYDQLQEHVPEEPPSVVSSNHPKLLLWHEDNQLLAELAWRASCEQLANVAQVPAPI